MIGRFKVLFLLFVVFIIANAAYSDPIGLEVPDGTAGDPNIGSDSEEISDYSQSASFNLGQPWEQNASESTKNLVPESLPGVASNIALTSPQGSLKETMEGKSVKNLLSASQGHATSPLSIFIQSWKNVSANSSEGMMDAMNLANSLTALRYQSEQAAQVAFESAGSQGKLLSQTYRTCIGNLVEKGFSYASSQEACMKNQGRRFIPSEEDVTLMDVPEFSFIHHSSHPKFNGPLSIKLGNEWSMETVNNANLNGVSLIFPGDAPENKNPKIIRLSHLMYIPVLRHLSFNGSTGNIVESYVRSAKQWRELFGDIEFSYQQGTIANSPTMSIAISKIAPTYTYAADAGSVGGDVFPTDLYNTEAVKGFGQYVTFRQHFVYYKLWKVLTKFCRFKIINTTNTATSAATDAFWTPSTNPTDDNKMTNDDYAHLSISFKDESSDGKFTPAFAQDLFDVIQGQINTTTTPLCDVIDPTLASTATTTTTGPRDLLAGETSVKKLVNQGNETNLTIVDIRNLVNSVAAIIVGGQVSNSVHQWSKLVNTIGAGDFESEAKKQAYNLLVSMTGVDPANSLNIRQGFQNSYAAMKRSIKARKINAGGN
jgi:hypothetical protein